MAEKSSPSASSTSTTTANVGKLYRLLFDGGTKALKIQLEKHFTPFPSKLVNFLKTNPDEIQKLVERNVINRDQLNQLHPDGGSDPDPEKFDISLIIPILTNFCSSVRRPRTGWDNMPHEKDRSLSAKLVRLRLFRNKLVHSPNTRFIEKEFLDLSKNLRGILCSLGLPSSDIENFWRLEDCDEKYYFELLKKWADSEEDSKRRFKAIYENQVKAQQTLQDTNQRVHTVEQNQVEASKLQQVDHKTLEDTHQVAQDTNQRVHRVEQNQREADKLRQVDHRTLADTHQVAQDTNQRVLLVEQNQMEAGKLQQEDHRTLEDTRQVAQDTNQGVHRVEQNQMEADKLRQVDHRTLADTHQVAQDTNQRVHRIEQNQMEAGKLRQVDHRTLADTHQVAKGVQRSVKDTKQIVEKVLRTQQETQQQIKKVAADAKERRDKGKEDEALRKLAKVDTERVIQYHSGKYQEGTRLHIFEKIKLWLDDLTSENRVMVISGDAGMGKSVIAAVVCQRMQHAGRLSGSHFCQHNKERYRNPKVMLQSLACQLCDVLPEYKSELVKKLSRNLGVDMNSLEVQELFEFLFEEPLCGVGDPGRNLLLVIDGLDESEYKGRNELLDVIANHFCSLPAWVRFCVTARPEVNIASRLTKFNPVQLKQEDEENVKDIRLFLERQLSKVIQLRFQEVVISELARKAAGHILYAYLMADFINNNFSSFTPEDLGRTLPSGVSSVYQKYFERLEKDLKSIEELTISADQFLTFLSAFAAAKEPLPLDFVSKMLRSDAKSLACHRKVRKAIDCISTLLPVQDGCIHFFHKSVKDWLTDRTANGEHRFSVNEKQGHLALSELCTDELNDVKRKGFHDAEISGIARYALQHGVYHMLESEEVEESTRSFEEIVNNYVTDLDIVYAKLCVHNLVNFEDIIFVQKREAFKTLSVESKRALRTLLSLLRKYNRTLTAHHHAIFQVMANEGGDVFAGEAKKLLQTRYHEIPYMTYVHSVAEEKQCEWEAFFSCTSPVVCFDISPQQEFMVCECMDGTIYLWSLQTGILQWTRPVKIKKNYDDCEVYRTLPNSPVLSFYRSVAFHPSQTFVLPGILSHAYSFEGDLLPLFPRSNCRFSVCSIKGDENKMITDCHDDAKHLVMWNLENGEKITQIIRNEVVLSFAWSPDGNLLAISHFSGLICLVDAKNCFKALAEVAIPQACGIIKFAPSLQFLYCLCMVPNMTVRTYPDQRSFCLMVSKSPSGIFSLDLSGGNFDLVPRVDESFSKGGYLMGDPIAYDRYCKLSFVLNNESELSIPCIGSEIIVMYRTLEHAETYGILRRVAFAIDGKTVYGVTEGNELALVSLDVSSGELKAEKKTRYFTVPEQRLGYHDICLIPVMGGVLFKVTGEDVQLWNSELSQCRSWRSLCEFTSLMPVSDRCVACVGKGSEVSVLDTSSGDIVKTIPLHLEGCETGYVLCNLDINSKYQLLFKKRDSVQLSDGKRLLWKRTFTTGVSPRMFSPTGEYVIISVDNGLGQEDIVVLDASSGNTLHKLNTVNSVFDCAFVSNTGCVIGCTSAHVPGGTILQLFNVATGDLLSVLDMFPSPPCWASFPQKGLIAVGHNFHNLSNRLCSFIEIKLPRENVNQEGTQCFFCSSKLLRVLKK